MHHTLPKTDRPAAPAWRRNAVLMAATLAAVAGPARAQSDARPKNPIVVGYLAPLAGQFVGGLFGRALDWLNRRIDGALPAGAAAEPAQGGAAPLPALPPNMPADADRLAGLGYVPPPPTLTAGPVRMATGVLYAIDRLNADYSIRETINLQAGVVPSLASREKFAIRYTSNLPGVVVILNVDALRKTAYLGSFLVRPGVEMRFPEQAGQAMVLDDTIGLETYQMLFMPCLPPALAGQPDAARLQGLIPACGSTVQAEQAIVLAQRSRRAKGTYSEALPLADGSSPVVFSAAPYEKGDVVATTFTIDHTAAVAAPAPVPLPATAPAPVPALPAAPVPARRPVPATPAAPAAQPGVTGQI